LWVWNVGEKLKATRQLVVQLFRPRYMRQHEIAKILEKRQAEAEHILLGRGTQNIEMPAGSSLLSMHNVRKLDQSLANELRGAAEEDIVIKESTVGMNGQERDIFFIARREGSYVKVIAIDVTDVHSIDQNVSVNRAFVEDRAHFDTIFETFLQTRPENGNGPGRIVNTAVEHRLGFNIEVDGNIEKLDITAFEGEALQAAMKRSPNFIWKSTSLGDRVVGVKLPSGKVIMENDKGQGWQIYLNDNLCLIIKDGRPVFLPPTEIYVNTSGCIKLKFERAMISDSEAERYIARRWGKGCLHSCTTAEMKRTGGAVPISYFVGMSNQENGIVRMTIPENKRFEVSSVFIQFGHEIWLASRAKQMEMAVAQKRVVAHTELALETPVIRDKPNNKERHRPTGTHYAGGFFDDSSCIPEGILASVAMQASQNGQKGKMADADGPAVLIFSDEMVGSLEAPVGRTIDKSTSLQAKLLGAVVLQAPIAKQACMRQESKNDANEKKGKKIRKGMPHGSGRKTYATDERKDGSLHGSGAKKKPPTKPAPFSALTSFKAVIFDLDGVVVDSEAAHRKTFNEVFAQFGVNIGRKEWAEKYTGVGSHAVIRDVFAKNRIAMGVEEGVLKRAKLYQAHIERRGLPVIPGFRPLCSFLRQNGVKVALGSGTRRSHIRATLRSIGLGPISYVGHEDVKNHKPAPDTFLLAARKLGLEPSECIVAEDSLSGVEAAARAGMPCVALSTTLPARKLRGKATLIVNNFRSRRLKKALAALLARKEKGAQAKGKRRNGRKPARRSKK